MSQAQMQRHSTSIRGLARDTETAVLEKFKVDLPRTLEGGREGGVSVLLYTEEEAEAMGAVGGAAAAPVPAVLDVDDGYMLLQDKDLREGEQDEKKEESGSSSRDKAEEDARLRELVESLGLAEALNLDALEGGGGYADPNSPFAKKAVAAYEAFVQAQKEGGGEGGGDVASAVAGMGEVVLDELDGSGKEGGATPEDVRAMFEGGVRSAMQEADRVAAKGQRRKRVLAAVKEVAQSKEKEEEGGGGVKEGLVTLQMMFEGTGLKGGMDVLAGPPGETSENLASWERRREGVGDEEGAVLQSLVEEEEEEDEDEWDESLGATGEADPLGDVGWDVAARFDLLVRELEATVDSPDLLAGIASQYHNVFLSRHFLGLMRARLEACEAAAGGEEEEEGGRWGRGRREVTAATPVVLARMVTFAEQLVVQVQEMGQLYELQQLDKIKAICAVAEEDMSKLSEYVSSRKDELDEDFVRYLQYLLEAEKARLKGAGVARPEREPSNWLMILEIVKKGVYHEMGKAVRDDVSMVHFITRFEEADEREHLARAHIARLTPSQVIPFKRVVTQMVDHFESRVNDLTEAELALAGKVLEVEDILEEVHPDSSLLALLQTKEGGLGLEAYKTGAETLLHDPREWDDSALVGREDELFSPEYLAAKYDRILKHYGFTASSQEGRGMGNVGEDKEEEGKEDVEMGKILGEGLAGAMGRGSAGTLPVELAKAVAGEGKEEVEEVEETGGAGSILEALQEEGVL
eukprot:evm.model.NODE_29647_length_52634_cov_57.405155.19